ncbi:putative disease resistance protein RGA1 [Papaver somniferum]|uniref:putative disease resistance protein RGA1 n=1 Tax=Papaver somniferum TaxID=3469 RepID=UPI000E6FB5E7|nr:putative disease resistance protein RGA1 [Papaver somniferum]
MAETCLNNTTTEILQKLRSIASKGKTLPLSDVKEDFKSIQQKLCTIQALISDALHRQDDKSVTLWLEKLRCVVYDTTDILDEFLYEAHRCEIQNSTGNKVHVTNFFVASDLLRVFSHKICGIDQRMIDASNGMNGLCLKISDGSLHTIGGKDSRETSMFVDDSDIVIGRESDRYKVVEMLLKVNSLDERVSVIPIVGGAGIGKKYLLVIDDVQDKDLETLFEMLNQLCTFGAKGSKIVFTARSDDVVRGKFTWPAYKLQKLTEDECWFLFKQRAFWSADGEKEIPNLVAIGKDIAKKCDGSAMVAKSLGGLMHSKKEEHEWLSVRDSHIWGLNYGDENEVLRALKLCYDHLPLHLKQCFAYGSKFPRGWKVEKETLIQLWMAEGFLQRPCDNNG